MTSTGNIHTTDNKAIEEKALNYFKTFIEDSKVISQFLSENDKEPIWDGHLFLYSSGKQDKEHFLGRVPVQIKGTEVSQFQTKRWKFRLEKSDLKAYLNEPTFFIVCQIKKNSRERKLFYREFLPETVKRILYGMGKSVTRKVLFHPLEEDLHEFENRLIMFLRNSRKMISYADKPSLTLTDALKNGFKKFSFMTPVKMANDINLLNYLSTHETYLYAKVMEDLDIEIPISDGPMKFNFFNTIKGNVKVGERVFYQEYKSEIKDGKMIITIADIMTLTWCLNASNMKPTAKMLANAKYLKDSIYEAEFLIALHETGILTIGNLNLKLLVNERDAMRKLYTKLEHWKRLQNVLDKLHVIQPLDLTSITKKQEKLIDILIKTIGNDNTVKIPNQQTTILLMEIGNIKLLGSSLTIRCKVAHKLHIQQ